MPGRLLAISDLHVSYPQNRQWVEDLPAGAPGDWLLVVGDVGEKMADIEGRYCDELGSGSSTRVDPSRDLVKEVDDAVGQSAHPSSGKTGDKSL